MHVVDHQDRRAARPSQNFEIITARITREGPRRETYTHCPVGPVSYPIDIVQVFRYKYAYYSTTYISTVCNEIRQAGNILWDLKF